MFPTLKRSFIFGICILGLFLILMIPALAQDPEGASGNLVPCGTSANSNACSLCDLYVLVKRVINFLLFGLALPIAVVMMLLGGMYILTSMGSEERIKQGKAAIYNTVIGAVLAFAAWLIINTILTTLGFKFTWTEIPVCQPPIVSTSTVNVGPNQGGTPNTPGGPPASNTGGPGCTVLSDPANACNPSNLSGCTWNASEASRLCNYESSGGQVGNLSRTDRTDNADCGGRPCAFSIGLFQINLAAHTIGGEDCRSLFTDRGLQWHTNSKGRRYQRRHYTVDLSTPEKQAKYQACVNAATTASTNIEKACELYKDGGWRPWLNTQEQCNIR
jgi:hypothetical protein